MRASLRALLEGLIDYAGLFPPAKLPMAEALANYQSYSASPDAWMLGRFVCPASRLKEVPTSVSLPCSALARGGETPEAYLAGLDADLADIAASHARVEALEVKLPPDPTHYHHLVEETDRRLAGRGMPVFYEVPWADSSAVMRLCSNLLTSTLGGSKLRTGGMEASAFPSSEQLVFALFNGISCGRPVKATAGLHHPLPRWDDGARARMHGFVNLFVAGVLIHAIRLPGDLDAIWASCRELLDDEDPSHFAFSDQGLQWREFGASLDQIREARRAAVLSFGSCSFDEPRDDLRALGWL